MTKALSEPDLNDPDRAVAKRLLAGDETAFAEVFDDYFPRLYRYALARVDGNGDEAREVVQQTFCKAFERLDSYRGEASLFGWMCRICRNALIDRARRRNRRIELNAFDTGDDAILMLAETLQAPAIDEPERALERLQLLQLVQATLDCLPARYGNVLEWKYVEGLSVKSIAVRLGVGPKAAESTLTRARAAFRDALSQLADTAEVRPVGLQPRTEG